MSEGDGGKKPADASSPAVETQLSAAMVGAMNAARHASEAAALETQRDALSKALSEVINVREFIGRPEEILGNPSTKHGEIAEVVEVGVRNAFDYVNQVEPTAGFPRSRIAPEDIVLDGANVQMKTINGVNKGLDHVLEHMNKNPGFGRDESFYLIPKDQLATIQRVLAGDTTGLKASTVEAIRAKVAEIEQLSGKPFDEAVKASSTTYAQVQQGAVLKTLDEVDEELHAKNAEREQEIVDEHAPSLGGAMKAAAGGAAVGGVFGFVGSSANKYFKEGKNVFKGDFDAKDWKDVGLDTAKGAAVGGVSAGAIYVLTNFAGTSAPVAGAFVGAVRGISVLLPSYMSGEIDAPAFVDQALFTCTDVSVTTMFAVAGQTAIPVPILGALIGSIAGKMVTTIVSNASKELQDAVQKKLEDNLATLSAEHRKALEELRAEFLPKTRMVEFVFSTEANAQCIRLSAHLARMHGIPEREILKDEIDVLAFLTAGGPSGQVPGRA